MIFVKIQTFVRSAIRTSGGTKIRKLGGDKIYLFVSRENKSIKLIDVYV